MPRPGPATLASLKTLFETKRGKVLPLPPNLARLYGCLRMPLPRSDPHVFSNFVTTLDGVVSFNAKGHASGADISGLSAQDRAATCFCVTRFLNPGPARGLAAYDTVFLAGCLDGHGTEAESGSAPPFASTAAAAPPERLGAAEADSCPV